MKIGLLLSGCGVYDGAEIQETVLAMLAIKEAGHEYVGISINKNQHHVVNHISGQEMPESRNMLIESARITRGEITEINQLKPVDIDALVIPGGFGSAKNFTKWAFNGPEGVILPEVKLLLVNLLNVGKPIVALCVSPVVLAKAFEDSGISIKMTIGSDKESSPYKISEFTTGIEKTGAKTCKKTVKEIQIDKKNRIITAPCYMMEATILDIRNNIKMAIDSIADLMN
jgi:enhancing lycopene biosynthesis protein 2